MAEATPSLEKLCFQPFGILLFYGCRTFLRGAVFDCLIWKYYLTIFSSPDADSWKWQVKNSRISLTMYQTSLTPAVS